MIRFALCVLAMMATQASAQQNAAAGTGAVLRGLDRINGEAVDLEMSVGQVKTFGRLQIKLIECRYREGNLAGNAFAALDITETGHDGKAFSGWMISSAPALSAMDHSRYDVWVLRCTTS